MSRRHPIRLRAVSDEQQGYTPAERGVIEDAFTLLEETAMGRIVVIVIATVDGGYCFVEPNEHQVELTRVLEKLEHAIRYARGW